MSALSHQVNMNNFLSLLVGASLVAANSSPSHHEVTSFTQPTEFSNGVSSFALPAEDGRMVFEAYTLANLKYSVVDANNVTVQEKDGMVGKFGEGRILNRTGILVHVTKFGQPDDHTGCTKDWNGTKGEPLPSGGVSWIALIRRGYCNFEEKVKHAYSHGAAAVIIYNDKEDPRLDKMKINDKERNITAIFITKGNGNELIASLEQLGHEVIMSIKEGDHHYRSITNINRTSVLFVSISFIVLMIISLVWLVFYYVQRFRYLQTKDKQSRRLCNVAKRIIAKIPTKSIKSDDKEIDNDCCAVCIEPYKVTDVIRVLPCKHEFHKTCIDPWLLEHRTCPMCKMDILKHYGFVFTGSQESILQLDLDMEEGDLIDDHSSTDGGYQRRNSVSPLPQIRASSENQLSRSSSESELDHIPRRSGGTSSHHHSNRQSLERDCGAADTNPGGVDFTGNRAENDICVGCLAAALNKKQRNLDSNFSQDDADSDTFSSEQHGSSSLPATLKKYKGNHSTGSCRGMNPPDHYHQYPHHADPQQQQSHFKLPFKFYQTDHGQVRKVRTPLRNIISQSVSAPCDDGSLTDIDGGGGASDVRNNTSRATSGVPLTGGIVPTNPARRCSLSRTSSSGSESRNQFAHFDPQHQEELEHQHQQQQHHFHHHHPEQEPDDVGSDETEPNSDNDLIAKSGDTSDGECKKK